MVLLVVRHRKFAHFTMFRLFKLFRWEFWIFAKLSKIKVLSKMQFETSQTEIFLCVKDVHRKTNVPNFVQNVKNQRFVRFYTKESLLKSEYGSTVA